MSQRIHVAHIVFRFDTGGLENGVVNLINHLPSGQFQHTVIALTEATDFRQRIRADGVAVHTLGKRPGKDIGVYARLYRLLRSLRPDIVHTRNLGTLDMQIVALLARVPARLHGEHGWDISDPDGVNPRFRRRRRMFSPLLHRFVTVSRDLERWLVEKVGIPQRKIVHICNGVDLSRFQNGRADRADLLPAAAVVVGTVTRFEPIKDPMNLARAFVEARRRLKARGSQVDLWLLMVGDGPLRVGVLEFLEAAGEAGHAVLPGNSSDVPRWLACMDLFALGSRREGISNTVLEAMASGLSVVASATGGNLELVVPSQTGTLVPPENSDALAGALVTYAVDPGLRERHGRAAADRAHSEYSLQGMVERYGALYRDMFAGRRSAA
jgi:sugar transferase (PEP-CTERM/EpsH1 system associated)